MTLVNITYSHKTVNNHSVTPAVIARTPAEARHTWFLQPQVRLRPLPHLLPSGPKQHLESSRSLKPRSADSREGNGVPGTLVSD